MATINTASINTDTRSKPIPDWKITLIFLGLFALIALLSYAAVNSKKTLSVAECQEQTCLVTVNYESTVSEYISSGGYQWVNPAFTDEHFGADTFRGIRNVPLRIIALPNIPIDRVLDELTKQSYRPATSREILAMIASGVLENFHGTLVAPGTLWKVPMGHVAVPAFENIKGFKTMEVFGAGVLGWRDRIFFAAVPIR